MEQPGFWFGVGLIFFGLFLLGLIMTMKRKDK